MIDDIAFIIKYLHNDKESRRVTRGGLGAQLQQVMDKMKDASYSRQLEEIAKQREQLPAIANTLRHFENKYEEVRKKISRI